MKTIKIWNDNPSQQQLDEAVAVIEQGGVVLMPTDTLYALVCDSTNPKAIERICKVKGINPEKTNLSIICSSISMAAEYAHFDNSYFRLLKDLTPGPYTFLFRAASKLPRAFKGRKVVGIRIPDSQLCRQLAESLSRPLMTTSINYDSEDYAINPELIVESQQMNVDLALIDDDGGLEPSTILDCTGCEPTLNRAGKGSF